MVWNRIIVPGYVYCDRLFDDSKEALAVVIKYQDGEVSIIGYSGIVPEEKDVKNIYNKSKELNGKVFLKRNWGWERDKFNKFIEIWKKNETEGFLEYEDIEFLYDLKNISKPNGMPIDKRYDFLI